MENVINHEAINEVNSKILDNIKKRELEEKIEAVKQDIITYAQKLSVDVVFGTDKRASVSINKDIAFPAKHSAERNELIKLLKEEGLWGDVEDLDVFALKKIVHNREWDLDILNKLLKYQEEKATAAVRLGKLDKEKQ